MRKRFLWRIAGLFLFVSIWFVGAGAIVAWIVGRAIGVIEGPPLAFILAVPGIVLATVVLAGFVLGGRALRGFAAPVGELIDALERLAAGDHTARVRERGPREVRDLAAAFNATAARLERSDAQRRALLADVTHELRTPLTVIQAQAEGLLDGVYPPQERHIAPIVQQAQILSRLVDDLRTLSLAESGVLELHREQSVLPVLLERSLAVARAEAEPAGIELRAEIPVDLPAVECDPIRIAQVLGNLLSNALRYTPRGGTVTLSARADPRRDAIVVAIGDTGAGISADALPHVFDRFYRSGDSSGSGLGLAIAKGLVVAHGGEIGAESDGPGRGTTVRFTLPRTPPRP